MTTLFYDSFQNTLNWIGRDGGGTNIVVGSDPIGNYQGTGYFSSSTSKPDAFSKVITSSFKSFTVSFDYLGFPKSDSLSINLGGIISISDGASLSDATIVI